MKIIFAAFTFCLAFHSFADESKNYLVYEAFSLSGLIPEEASSILIYNYKVSCQTKSNKALAIAPYVDKYNCVLNNQVKLTEAQSKVLFDSLVAFEAVEELLDWDGVGYNIRFENIKVRVALDQTKLLSGDATKIIFN